MMMEEFIANVDDIKFDIEIFLEQQTGIQPLPFPGMDKSASAVCEFFTNGICLRGALCPMRHISGEKNVVCKHWLRGLCKKGDDCEFLHEYDMTKMPECYFYSKYGSCNNKECPFLHIDPESKIKDCPWYDRGFCKHGPHCKHRHVRRVICINYVCGFCPDGRKCKFMHPKFDLPLTDDYHKKLTHIICHACGEPGHKSSFCPNHKDKIKHEGPPMPGGVGGNMNVAPAGTAPNLNPPNQPFQQGNFTGRRPMEFVTCFKCRLKGHYANQCPYSKNELFGQTNIRPPRFPPREHFELQTQSIPTLGSSR